MEAWAFGHLDARESSRALIQIRVPSLPRLAILLQTMDLTGRSPRQAIQDMENLAKQILPKRISYEWTGLSLEELKSGKNAAVLFGLGLLVVLSGSLVCERFYRLVNGKKTAESQRGLRSLHTKYNNAYVITNFLSATYNQIQEICFLSFGHYLVPPKRGKRCDYLQDKNSLGSRSSAEEKFGSALKHPAHAWGLHRRHPA